MRFHLQIALLLMTSSALDAKLTAEENQKRLDECGKVPTLWVARFTITPVHVTPISPKNLLAKASDLIQFDPIINKITWRHNSSEFKPDCKDGKMYFEVPSEAVKRIRLYTWENYYNMTNPVNPIKGYLIGLCSPSNLAAYYLVPLVLEIADEVDDSYACLGDVNVNVGDSGKAIAVADPFGVSLIETPATIESIEEDNYITKTNINVNGASLIINSDNKWIALGSYYYDRSLIEKNLRPAFRVSKYSSIICDATGICDLPSTTPAPLPTIQPKNTDNKKNKNEENGGQMKRVELIIVFLTIILWI